MKFPTKKVDGNENKIAFGEQSKLVRVSRKQKNSKKFITWKAATNFSSNDRQSKIYPVKFADLCLKCGQHISNLDRTSPIYYFYCSSFCYSQKQQQNHQKGNRYKQYPQHIKYRTCFYCHETFPSRTSLFEHLNQFTSHQVDYCENTLDEKKDIDPNEELSILFQNLNLDDKNVKR